MIEVERKFVLGEDVELNRFETLAPALRVGSVEQSTSTPCTTTLPTTASLGAEPACACD